MEDRRVFLGWERPALVSAAEWLLGRAERGGGEVDLSHLTVVMPGARAGRVLLALLAEQAGGEASGGGAIVPPRMLTPGRLVELLAPAPGEGARRPAAPMVKCAAWSRALRGLGPGVEAICPGGLEADDSARFDTLARMVLRAHDELAMAGMRLSEVPRRAAEVMLDEARWAALAEAEERYLALLAEAGLADPVVEAREALTAGRPLAAGAGEVALIGVTELAAAARAIVQRAGAVALVAAPQSLADRFDDLGCVIPAVWAEAQLPIDDRRLVFCADPRDEALCAAGIVARDHASRAPGAITIGAAEPGAVAPLKRACRDGLGVQARSATGRPASQAPVGRLLGLMADFLELQSFRSFAALVRSPLMEHALLRRARGAKGRGGVEWWLGRLDRYHNEHHPRGVGGWRGRDAEALTDLERGVRRLLRPLTGRPRAAADWAEPIGVCLRRIVRALPRAEGAIELRQREAEAQVAGEALTELSQLGALAPGEVPASTALRLLEARLAEVRLPEEAGADCIEILGWLELPLDPAPALVITGLTEQALGASRGDGLITLPLRRALGLPDDAARLARDAAAMATILGTRPDAALLCPRRDALGNPQAPSRLLLMAGAETIARRLLRFASEGTGELEASPRVAQPVCGERCGFYPAPILGPAARAAPAKGVGEGMGGEAIETIETMYVTDFGAFLKSPYLYYLQRVMRAEAVEDCAAEMDAMRFGSLLHAVLEAFGRSEARGETRAERIEAFLRDALAEIALERFGATPPVAVWVQLDMARRRLARFAHWQAEWAKEGWRIVETEWKPAAVGGGGAGAGAARLEIPGQAPVALRGKIDRIDVRDGEIAILDYKTGARCEPPSRTHGPTRDGSWRDLQLPLYRTLYPPAAHAARVRLGYVALPSETDQAALQEADWSADQLDDAIETARAVVRRIREMAFDDFGRLGGWRQDFATEAILARGQITSVDRFARLTIAAPGGEAQL